MWWRIDATTGLIRERVGHFWNGNPAPDFQKDWFWTGDQGLMLANLSDAWIAGVVSDLKPVEHLLAGVTRELVGVVDGVSGALLSYSATGTVPGYDYDDYNTGSGVFWRNVLYVWLTNPNGSFARDYVRAMLQASAEAAMKSGDQSFDALTNQTSVLVAATRMLS